MVVLFSTAGVGSEAELAGIAGGRTNIGGAIIDGPPIIWGIPMLGGIMDRGGIIGIWCGGSIGGRGPCGLY